MVSPQRTGPTAYECDACGGTILQGQSYSLTGRAAAAPDERNYEIQTVDATLPRLSVHALMFVFDESIVVIEQDSAREQTGADDSDCDKGKGAASFTSYQRNKGKTGDQGQHQCADKSHHIRRPRNLFHDSPLNVESS
jgi:hypothetical protein